MHSNSMKLMKYFRDKYLTSGESILDIGSQRVLDQQSYKILFSKSFKYTGMDIEAGKNVDIIGYENIKDSYDVVISGQTMEHVNHPWDWLKGLKRYYRKYICIIAPNKIHEHRFPVDTYRYFPDGMRDLFNYAGIKEIEIFKNRHDTIGVGSK